MEIKKLMYEYRVKHDLSMEKFARLCNISIQTVYCIERGLQTPSARTREKIMAVINKGA